MYTFCESELTLVHLLQININLSMNITCILYRYNMRLNPKRRALSELTADGEFSCINKPLLDLELDHIIPGELHLMLRVTDVLIRALIETARAYDKHQRRVLGIQRSYKALDGLMLKNLISAIRNCEVYFNVYEDEQDGTVECPSLLGPDKMKLLKHLPDKLVGCQPTEMVKLT